MDTHYRRDIEGLRALAVLSVIAYHAFPAIAPGGFVGVDVFFVISGFLITGIIARERDAAAFSWGRFYLRRARRILPALVAVTLTIAALAACIELPLQLRTTGGVLGVSGLFAANIGFTQTPGYFDPVPQQSPFLHLWSLGVEEQFYLLWPALIALLWLKPLKRARPWLALILAALSLAFAESQLAAGAISQAFFSLAPRAWEFLAGALLVFGVPAPNTSRAPARNSQALGARLKKAWLIAPAASWLSAKARDRAAKIMASQDLARFKGLSQSRAISAGHSR